MHRFLDQLQQILLLFVFLSAACFSISFVSAFPISRQTIPEPSYENDDRSSTLQVLAGGTQDLAALIGLFATDSVERYAVDYSRGYLGAALAPCSMFGILGYVRALIKLAIGRDACVAASFPTAPVRSILGVPAQDRLPGDELVTVNYLRRTQVGNTITWKFTKAGKGRERKKYLSKQKPPRKWHVWMAIVVSTGVNSLLILAIGPEWRWYKVVASVVMFATLTVSSLMWATVYMAEQVPVFGEDGPVCLEQRGECAVLPLFM
ncbi:hypothetical protein QBC38DRAFT_547859 [Podospora fimiseda]|uniref:Uncharacterized protein n=1 Tax=Podospora fimiseda TaxID=252190 RepID=A0AAN7BIZ8_9PEZI|nr:hypothetical protein QBC38DRAFT_547859 [Podospora fimiseda]